MDFPNGVVVGVQNRIWDGVHAVWSLRVHQTVKIQQCFISGSSPGAIPRLLRQSQVLCMKCWGSCFAIFLGLKVDVDLPCITENFTPSFLFGFLFLVFRDRVSL